MNKFLIVVAGGKGLRMGGELPKQFMIIGDKPLLMHTLQQFYTIQPDIRITLVLPKDHITYWNTLCKKYRFDIPCSIIEGGNTRFQSVKNALNSISETEGVVAIHDGVRPFPAPQVIKNAFSTALKTGSAIPVLPLTDSIRFILPKGSKVADRSSYRIVQTPQTFNLALLKQAYSQPYDELFTDDASVVEALGKEITLIDGNRENIKITHPSDLLWAETYLKRQ
ncbi:MAG: 2-C-methyl-D-erythritol 4-phosphate cytidylyltransferase [Bacteroidales bacterium]|nr:2-C-methyl-D-erythritol 4-phosphate cytidylyltransferase [Bacteroidales bacterium]